jgi:hypothetical protein
MKMTQLIPLSLCFTIMGCNKAPNFAELCEQNPEICLEFEEDSWCKRERIVVGFANLTHKQQVSEQHKFEQLIAYEGYEKCMEHASKIEHIKLKVKRTMRINNIIKAQKKIKDISLATKNSDHPDLLYFHWSRYLDERALNKFIALEGHALLEKPARQVYLASYYAKRDPTKTLRLLYHALELYKADEMIDTEIFKSISSIFADKKEYKQAYIWSKVLHLYDPQDENINEATLKNYSDGFALDATFLDKVAKSTLNKITSGQFTSPQV